MRFFLLALCAFSVSCAQFGDLQFVAELPGKINECSGIVSYGDDSIWLIEDSGNDDALYQVNFQGDLLTDLEVDGGANQDWEDLTRDYEGNLYIGDLGNNSGNRKGFTIHKLPDPRKEKGDKIPAEDIDFEYPEDDNDYTPDAEALFYYNDNLYVITRNRGRPFTGVARIFKLPAQPGEYIAEYVGSFTTCEERRSCQVTAAEVSPDGNTLAILGSGKLWLVKDFGGPGTIEGRLHTIEIGATTQLESICFKNNDTLLLADEEHAGGGNIYRYPLN